MDFGYAIIAIQNGRVLVVRRYLSSSDDYAAALRAARVARGAYGQAGIVNGLWVHRFFTKWLPLDGSSYPQAVARLLGKSRDWR